METPTSPVIFIVEDNEMFSETLCISLELQGYTVHAFSSGEQMISFWEEDPDIILLDYFIHSKHGDSMNGDKILRFIRKINRSLPVVIMTSNTDIGEATSLLKKGAVDYILKDEDLQHNLDKTIHHICESKKLRREIAVNSQKIKKYRQHFLVISLIVALAAMTLLWLSA
jgi:DNA-binding NtrC family response regulator